MNAMLKSFLAVAGLALALPVAAQVTFYSGEGFHGRQFNIDRPMWDLDRTDFNDRASSAVVRGGRWLACEDAHFQGRCVTLRPGEYPSLDRMGLDKRISSIRPVENYGRADERNYDRYAERRGYDVERRGYDYDYRR